MSGYYLTVVAVLVLKMRHSKVRTTEYVQQRTCGLENNWENEDACGRLGSLLFTEKLRPWPLPLLFRNRRRPTLQPNSQVKNRQVIA